MHPTPSNLRPLLSPVNVMSTLDPLGIVHEGWVLKKRRKKMQGIQFYHLLRLV